jgi:hypothetical protein
LIRRHALEITDTIKLYELILRHYPTATPGQVIAELDRQAAEDLAEAEALKQYGQELFRSECNE